MKVQKKAKATSLAGTGDRKLGLAKGADPVEGAAVALDIAEFEPLAKPSETPKRAELVEADDYLKAVVELRDEAVKLQKRGDLHGESMLKLATAAKRIHERQQEQESALALLKRGIQMAGDGLDLSTLAMRHKVPRHLDPLYYHLTAVDPQRLGYAAMFDGLDAGAMTPHLRAFARKRGLNEATQSHIYEAQALNDMVVMTDFILASNPDLEYGSLPRRQRVQRLKVFREYQKAIKGLRDAAMDTATAGEGGAWVPTIMSSQLHSIIMAQLILADQFEWPQMPSAAWTDPVEGYDPTAYIVSQALVDPAAANAKPTASIFETRSMTLTAVKFMARVVLSTEVEEDAILPIVPRVLFQLARAHARGRETALVNGFKTALSGFDTGDVPAAGNAKTAWDGLRWFQKSVEATLSAPITTETDLAVMSMEALAQMKGQLREYGQHPEEGVWLTGYSGFIRMLTITDKTSSGTPVVITLDKMGPNATFFRGQLGQVFGSPVIVSQYVREDMNASAIYDGSTVTKTAVYYLNKTCFKGGERRSYRVRRSDDLKMETDQIVVASSQRLAWAPVNYATPQRYIAVGKNVASY